LPHKKNATKVNRCLKKENATKNDEDNLLKGRPTGGRDEANDDREEEGYSGDGASIPEGKQEGQGHDAR